MGETASASRVVRLDDYRRDAWSAADATWEQVTAGAVAALGRGDRLQPALLLPRAERWPASACRSTILAAPRA